MARKRIPTLYIWRAKIFLDIIGSGKTADVCDTNKQICYVINFWARLSRHFFAAVVWITNNP